VFGGLDSSRRARPKRSGDARLDDRARTSGCEVAIPIGSKGIYHEKVGIITDSSGTCIATGARISEVLGLKWKHIDFKVGASKIEQRVWQQDVGPPKSEDSRRVLGLGELVDRLPRKGQRGRRRPKRIRIPTEACACFGSA
jgi:hypothetical protein